MCNPATTNNPDRLEAKGVYRDYEWEITRGSGIGFRCGYVRIPLGHPWHGQDYDNINPSVHGGLTFAAPDTECGLGGEDNAWWLGFDCCHAGDGFDPSLVSDPRLIEIWGTSPFREGPIRTAAYVQAECEQLIEQAAAAAVAA